MNTSHQIKIKALAVFTIIGVQYTPLVLYSQSSGATLSNGQADSIAINDSNESTYYEIEMLKLERWILKNTKKFQDPTLLEEIAFLKKEAENFAEANDYYTANLWIQTIWDLLEPDEGASEQILDNNDFSLPSSLIEPSKTFTWNRELITGVDFWRWRQDFNINSVPSDVASLNAATIDSSFLESNGNPFTGIRFKFDYGKGYSDLIQGSGFFKYSRDYVSGDLTAKIHKPLSPHASWRLENRFEGTSYFRNIDLQYWQNTTLFWLKLQPTNVWSFDVWDEFSLRRYSNDTSSYPSYRNNTIRAAAKANIGFGSFIQAGYRNVIRSHLFNENEVRDYRENRVDLTIVQSANKGLSLSLDNEFRFRDYTHSQIDTFSIFQDYWENDFSGDIRFDFAKSFGIQLKSVLTKRKYRLSSIESLPDYLYWDVEPQIFFNLPKEWKLGFGLFYGSQTHDLSFSYADYYRYGPVFTLELFQINGILLTFKESFLLERYPNIGSSNANTDSSIDNLINFYSDRNTNSISLFFTWMVNAQWKLHLILNMDDDRHQDDSGDSQNTLIGMDISYSF